MINPQPVIENKVSEFNGRQKKHFLALDGLRGIAAIAVVLFHFMEIAAPDYKDSFIPHSYLAVDFFFCLSGFVIAYAYDDKLAAMGKAAFFKRRLIRLQPMVFLGALIGLICFLFDPFSKLAYSFSGWEISLMFLSASFLIPYPNVPERYFNLFHLNPPTWSLFWEYIANIVYATVLLKMSNRVLRFIAAVAAVLLCAESYRSGYLAVGFGGDNFWAGGIRLAFSFTAGILLFRSRRLAATSAPFWVLALSLAIVFFIPYSETWSVVIDPILVIAYFPLLIYWSAGQIQRTDEGKQVCQWLGNLSYPLYMIHYPFIWLFMSYVETHQPSPAEMAWIIAIGSMLLILLAHLAATKVEVPVRRYLQKNRRQTA